MIVPVEKAILGGLHLAGPNSNKTALVILHYSFNDQKLIIKRVYEKIGSYGSLYSDDRLTKVLKFEGEPHALVVDAPLSVPPCVRCVQPTCPGVNSCSDVEVAFMISKSRVLNNKKKGRKVRPINPQCHRLWDVEQMIRLWPKIIEPSYSSNLAPLVIRAQVFQKRLRAEYPNLTLYETSIPLSLQVFRDFFSDGGEDFWTGYNDFFQGAKIRGQIFNCLWEKWFAPQDDLEVLREKIITIIPLFNAFICGLNAVFLSVNHKQNVMQQKLPPQQEQLFIPSVEKLAIEYQ